MINRLFRSIYPVWRMWCLFNYEAALRQIDPMHEDVPALVLRINELRRSAT